MLTPRELTSKILAAKEVNPVAILFGTENSGLTNHELQTCHYQIYIPTNPDYSSLNLASAVQLIAYELRLAFADDASANDLNPGNPDDLPLTREQMVGVLAHFDRVMQRTGYLRPEYGKHIDLRMNRLLNKAELTLSEMNILRGFLSSVEKYCRQKDE